MKQFKEEEQAPVKDFGIRTKKRLRLKISIFLRIQIFKQSVDNFCCSEGADLAIEFFLDHGQKDYYWLCLSCFCIFSLLVFGCLAICKFWVFCFRSPLLFGRAPRPRMQELVHQLPSSLISSSKHSITFDINRKIIQNY